MALTKDQFALVIRKLRERREEAVRVGRIDNSKLYAGSPMYYYCRLCGLLAATLHEEHTQAPPRHCEACDRLFKEYGLTMEEIDEALKDDPRYPTGHAPES